MSLKASRPSTRLVLLHSMVAFVLAFLVMVTVHEFAHAVTAKLLGGVPTVFPFSEADGIHTVGGRVIVAAAGPMFSLVSGIGVLLLPQVPRRYPFLRIAILWFGLLSVQEFSGYLIVGLLTPVGDVGSIYALVDTPMPVRVLLFLIGWAATYLTGRIATFRLLQMTDDTQTGTQLRALGLFAWLGGVLLALLVSLPTLDFSAEGLLEASGTLTAGVFLVFVRLFLRRIPRDREVIALRFPVVGIVVLLVVAGLRILVLGPGIHL